MIYRNYNIRKIIIIIIIRRKIKQYFDKFSIFDPTLRKLTANFVVSVLNLNFFFEAPLKLNKNCEYLTFVTEVIPTSSVDPTSYELSPELRRIGTQLTVSHRDTNVESRRFAKIAMMFVGDRRLTINSPRVSPRIRFFTETRGQCFRRFTSFADDH